MDCRQLHGPWNHMKPASTFLCGRMLGLGTGSCEHMVKICGRCEEKTTTHLKSAALMVLYILKRSLATTIFGLS